MKKQETAIVKKWVRNCPKCNNCHCYSTKANMIWAEKHNKSFNSDGKLKKKDIERQNYLEDLGYNVIRIKL